MKLTVPDAPKTISRKLVVQFIESMGMDPHDIKAIEMNHNSLYVTVALHNEDGKAFRFGPNEIATYKLYIEITD